MPRKRLTPQEKKIKSYQKDCRNRFGENDKSSRKAIPARKAAVNRSFRHGARQALASARSSPELLESALDKVQRGSWRKYSDEPLCERLSRGDPFWRQGLDSKRDDKRSHRKAAISRLMKSGRYVYVPSEIPDFPKRVLRAILIPPPEHED